MRHFAIALCVVLAAPAALAGGSSSRQPADLVPFGAEWWCFHRAETSATGTETPRCERTEAACRTTRASIADPSQMTDCGTQSTATVITYFDPKRSSWRYLVSPDDDGCLELRAGLVATKAYQRVAQCEIVGKRYPPPAKIATTAITPGKDWWCLELPDPPPKGARAICTRTVAACEDTIRRDSMASTKCKPHATAYLVTFKDASAWAFSASSTSDACASYRDSVIAAASSVSACTAIGEVARPRLDRKRIPRGGGWVCFAGADPQHPIGSCARTAKDCAAQYELDRYVLGASPGCKPQSGVFGRNVQDQFFAFPTAALCEHHIEEHPDGSRCEAVN